MNQFKPLLIFIGFLFSFLMTSGAASGILGGEITYTHVSGLTYQINATLYTKIFFSYPSIDSVFITDGSSMTLFRDSYTDFPGDIRESHYQATHTFTGAGIYQIYLIMPSRLGNIANIPNSFFTPFNLNSELRISAFCPNISVTFPDKPIFYAQKNRVYTQNINVLNPDHDSLSFQLVDCLGENNQPIPDYFFPTGFSIDPVSGEISSGGLPDSACIYDLAVKITEWKNGVQVGSVLRDYVVDIHADSTTSYFFNLPQLLQDTGSNYFILLNPYDTLDLSLAYIDSSVNPHIEGYGEAFSIGSPATFQINQSSSVSSEGLLHWIPDSFSSRRYPYIFTFRGINNIRETDVTLLVYINGTQPDSCYNISNIGVNEILFRSLLIYPNPVLDQLILESDDPIRSIQIYNSLGKNVYYDASYCQSCRVNCESLSPGIYVVKIIFAEKAYTKMFIKE